MAKPSAKDIARKSSLQHARSRASPQRGSWMDPPIFHRAVASRTRAASVPRLGNDRYAWLAMFKPYTWSVARQQCSRTKHATNGHILRKDYVEGMLVN